MLKPVIITSGKSWPHMQAFFPVLKYLPAWLRPAALTLLKPSVSQWKYNDNEAISIMMLPNLFPHTYPKSVQQSEQYYSIIPADFSHASEQNLNGTGIAFAIVSHLLKAVVSTLELKLDKTRIAIVGADIPLAGWCLPDISQGMRFVTLFGDNLNKLNRQRELLITTEGLAVSVSTNRKDLAQADFVLVMTESHDRLKDWPNITTSTPVMLLDHRLVEQLRHCSLIYNYKMRWDTVLPDAISPWLADGVLPLGMLELILLNMLPEPYQQPKPITIRYCKQLAQVYQAQFGIPQLKFDFISKESVLPGSSDYQKVGS